MTVELVILNYNGRHHLEHLLPTALREAGNYGPDCQVVVLDNRSTQDDVAWVSREFPSVKVWVAPCNEYLFSYNEYAKQSTAEILVLLNNDLKLCENFLPPLLRYFSQEDVFSVGATSLDWEGKEFTCGPSALTYENGFYDWKYDCSRQELCHTFFTSGGFMAVDRKKFLELGGFDKIYYPAYVEDVDLCFRAWRNGWRCIFEPASQVLHREGGSWKKTNNSNIDAKTLRNSLLFQWCNLPTSRDKWKRRRSVAKISLGELSSFRIHWMALYFQTLSEVKDIKKQKTLLPLNSKEVEKIINAFKNGNSYKPIHMKLHMKSVADKVEYLQWRAEECIIPSDDRYLNIYPTLIEAISKLNLDENNLSLIGSAVFGWMPTQLSLQHSALRDALQIMKDLKDDPSKNIDASQILKLANVFQAIGGKSVVAASKLLHFVFPDRFPIWDSIVAKEFGLAPNGEEAAQNYSKFITFCREMSVQTDVQVCLQVFKGRLVGSGYKYDMKTMRLIELLLFLD